jgi:hypothetical protein
VGIMCSMHAETVQALAIFVGKQEGKNLLTELSVNTRVA